MRSTPARSSANSAGRPARPSRAGSGRRSPGISTTRTGSPTSPAANTATGCRRITQAARHEHTQGHHPRRRLRHPAVSHHPGGLQAAAAGVRQADGVLPADHADAGRDPRHPADLHPAGHAALRAAARRRRAVGAEYPVRGAAAPEGLAQAFIIGATSSARSERAGAGRQHLLRPRPAGDLKARASAKESGATVFAYPVHDPERYGVVEFDAPGMRVSLEEKPRSRSRAMPSPACISTTTGWSTSPGR
jgi:hypothetical protein